MNYLEATKQKQKEYWEERSRRNFLEGEKSLFRRLNTLYYNYEESIVRIQTQIDAFYNKFAVDNKLDMSTLNKNLTTEEHKRELAKLLRFKKQAEKDEYIDPNYIKQINRLYNNRTITRLESLQSTIQNEVELITSIQHESLTTELFDSYKSTILRTSFDVQQFTSVHYDLNLPNGNAIMKVVSANWIGDNYSDRIWANKDRLVTILNQEMTQGMILGRNPKVIARSIQEEMDTNYNNAVRLARTEFTHIANEASVDAYEMSESLEKYQFVATLDDRTSVICGELDSKIFFIKDRKAGVNFPPLHPRCRSTNVPFFEDEEIRKLLKDATRIVRDSETKKNYFVPASMTYNEWLKKYDYDKWLKQTKKKEKAS